MKKVDLIFSSRLSSPNGDSRVVRTFAKSDPFLKKLCVNLAIISADLFFESEVDYALKSKKGGIKRLMKKIIPFSSFLTIKFLKKGENNKKRIVDYYNSQDRDTDIVFFHEILACYHYLKQRKNTKEKVVLVIHSNGDTFKMLHIYFPKLINTSYFKYLVNAEKEVLEHVDKLGFVSQSSMENFRNNHPKFDSEKLFYVYNGINNKVGKPSYKLQECDPKYSFCCAGSISKRKGQEIIIKAISRLSLEEKKLFKITFLGDGSDLVNLLKLVKLNKLEKQIVFKGFVNDVTSQLKVSNGFILTSLDEGLPVSIIEALRIGLPIISSKVGGIPEMVIDGFNGFLIEPNEDELVEVFKSLSKYDLPKMGENSLKIYNEKFTQNAMFLNYARVFLELN